MAKTDTTNLHRASAGVANAYGNVQQTTQSTFGSIASGLGDAIKSGIDGYKLGQDIQLTNTQQKVASAQNEILDKTKDGRIAAENAQNEYTQKVAEQSTKMLNYARHDTLKKDKDFREWDEARNQAQSKPATSSLNLYPQTTQNMLGNNYSSLLSLTPTSQPVSNNYLPRTAKR